MADPYILDWWAKVLPTWDRETRSQALAPVQTRLAYYSSSKKARAILGQPRSTIDLRRVIAEGGVLLVSTSQSKAGRDVSALVGASLLNLVDSVIREQGGLPADQRRGALVVVDEMQSIPGVDYESMLSELGKFGASFVLATQSLARLAELSPTMQDTLLANVSCLAVFQVAASDARQLIGELDRGRVDEEDLVSLPVHHCYVRATTGGQRLPTFTLAVRKPGDGGPAGGATNQGPVLGLHHSGGCPGFPGHRGRGAGQGVPGESGRLRRRRVFGEQAGKAAGQQPAQADPQRRRRRSRAGREEAGPAQGRGNPGADHGRRWG